jgi:hypothetical protein
MVNRGRDRVTADDYEAFFGGLCGIPPGPERDGCVRYLTQRLLALYAEYGGVPPPGLREFAERTGTTPSDGNTS